MAEKIIAAGAFIIKDNKVLLALRQNSSCDNGLYCIPGGRVENGEPVQHALIREIEEEVGLKVNPKDMQLAHVISFKKADGKELISFDFIVNAWQGEPVNNEPHKHAYIKWYDLNNLPGNLIERHKTAYENYKKGIYYSSFGY